MTKKSLKAGMRIAAFALLLSACNSGSDNSGAPKSTIGKRCLTAGSCDTAQTCYGRFYGERKVCTMACTEGSCPEGTCVNSIPDYSGGLVGPFCLRPCVKNEDCQDYGSVCETFPGLGDKRYCF